MLLLWPLILLASATFGTKALEAILDPATWQRAGFTAAQALLSTLLSLVAGLPVAYALSHVRFPGRTLLRGLATMPVVLPTVVVALGVQQAFGPTGWVNAALDNLGRERIEVVGTLTGILLAHVCFGSAIVVRLTTRPWAAVDLRQAEAAWLLGASTWGTFRHATLPALLPPALTAAVLVFMFAFTSFGVVLLLGTPNLDTIEVAVFRLASQPARWPAAAALTLVQLVMTATAAATYFSLQPTRSTHRVVADHSRSLRAASWGTRAMLLVAVLLVLAVVLLPLASLVAGAVSIAAFATLTAAGTRTSIGPIEALAWSIAFALSAALIATIVGGAAAVAIARARGRAGIILVAVLLAPVAVSAITVGFAYAVGANNDIADLRGMPLLVLLAQGVVAYPFVLRAVLPVARALPPGLAEAAANLGAAPPRAWLRVSLPLLSRALASGAVFAFVIALGEVGAALLLRRREFTTAPVALVDGLARPGTDGLASALVLATVLMGVSVVAFVVMERFRPRNAGEY